MYRPLILFCLVLVASAQRSDRALDLEQPSSQSIQQKRPVAILRYVNRLNDDGSYTYGYNAEDGSYKIETRYPDGQVKGKYGYYDQNGKFQEISYGASKRGFEPQVPGVVVAPPTLVDNSRRAQQQQEPSRQGPSQQIAQDYDYEYYDDAVPARAKIPLQVSNKGPDGSHAVPGQYSIQFGGLPFSPQPQRAAPAPAPAPVPAPAPIFRPRVPIGKVPAHPSLSHLDLNSGSYSLSYSGRK